MANEEQLESIIWCCSIGITRTNYGNTRQKGDTVIESRRLAESAVVDIKRDGRLWEAMQRMFKKSE